MRQAGTKTFNQPRKKYVEVIRICSKFPLTLAVGLLGQCTVALAGYINCSATQQADLESATYHAHELLQKSLENIALPQPNPNYSKWFGSYSDQNGEIVKNSFGKLKAHMTVGDITYHCGCGQLEIARPTVAAAVHAPKYGINEQPYHINICTQFFKYRNSGLDSRAGTIIHEMTHFDVVNSTQDFCKGAAPCEVKAATAPKTAVRSADNYQYFAESLE